MTPDETLTYEVTYDSIVIICQEVSGLAIETQVIEYRSGNGPMQSVIKMPGMAKYGNVSVKRGVVPNTAAFWDLANHSKLNTVRRMPMTISLRDDTGTPIMTWTLTNTWPISINHTEDADTIAIESIEFAHEGVTVTNHNSSAQ